MSAYQGWCLGCVFVINDDLIFDLRMITRTHSFTRKTQYMNFGMKKGIKEIIRKLMDE